MLQKPTFLSPIVLTVLLLLSGAVFAPQLLATTIHYEVNFKAPQTHYAEVEVQLSEVSGTEVELKMASWTPGSYLIREYARHLDYVKASGANGESLPIRKTSKNTWVVETGGNTSLSVFYEIYSFELTVRTCFIDQAHASIIPAAFFLYLADEDPASTIKFNPHSGWSEITTALPQVGTDKWTRSAPNRDILFDSPIEIGNRKCLILRQRASHTNWPSLVLVILKRINWSRTLLPSVKKPPPSLVTTLARTTPLYYKTRTANMVGWNTSTPRV